MPSSVCTMVGSAPIGLPRNGDDTSEEATQTWNREGPWHPTYSSEECHAVRDAAGILDLPGFSRYRLKGEGAAEFLRGQRNWWDSERWGGSDLYISRTTKVAS